MRNSPLKNNQFNCQQIKRTGEFDKACQKKALVPITRVRQGRWAAQAQHEDRYLAPRQALQDTEQLQREQREHLNGGRVSTHLRMQSSRVGTLASTLLVTGILLNSIRGATGEYSEPADQQTPATNAPSANESTANTLPTALHSSSITEAVSYFDDDNTPPTASLDTLFYFKDEACQNKTMAELLPNAPTSSVNWQRVQKPVASVTALNKEQFTTALGVTIKDNGECLESVSVETIKLPQHQSSVQHSAKMNQVAHGIENVKLSGEQCVQLKASGTVQAAKCHGDKASTAPTASASPSITTTTSAPQKISQHLGQLANRLCVKKLVLISDEAELITQSPTNTHAKTEHHQPMASQIKEAMLLRCPKLDVTKAKATVTLDKGLTEINSSLANTAHSLSSHEVMKTLSQVLDNLNAGVPDVIVMADVDEIPDYHPDVSVISQMVKMLKGRGIRLYAYAASPGSWLSRIPGVEHSDNLSEVLAQKARFEHQATHEPLMFETAVSVCAPLLGLAGLLLGCLYLRHKRGQEAAGPAVEEVELEAFLDSDKNK